MRSMFCLVSKSTQTLSLWSEYAALEVSIYGIGCHGKYSSEHSYKHDVLQHHYDVVSFNLLSTRTSVHGDGVHVSWGPPGIPASMSWSPWDVHSLPWQPLPASLPPTLFQGPPKHGHQNSQRHALPCRQEGMSHDLAGYLKYKLIDLFG